MRSMAAQEAARAVSIGADAELADVLRNIKNADVLRARPAPAKAHVPLEALEQ
eukprot:SAG31_NODE_5823_length_2308_cov_1.091444_2_plen_53_part_00